MKKRLIALLLTFVLVLGLCPVPTVQAATVASGNLTDTITWEITTNMTLTISDSGDMPDYASVSNAPWFSYRNSITSIVLDEATSVGNNAFSRLTNVTSVTLPATLTSIGEFAFSECTSLTSIAIPEGVTTIGFGAFSFCTALTSVTLPEGLTFLDSVAFCNCYALSSVTIPKSLTTYGTNTHPFSDSTAITDITYGDTESEWDQYALSGMFDSSVQESAALHFAAPSVVASGDF